MKELLHRIAFHPAFLVMLGGGIGSWLRYRTGQWFASREWAAGFPWGTLAVNAAGSFTLALLLMIYADRHSVISQRMLLLLGPGFCGGFTTFSTFSNEAVNLARNGHAPLALLYVASSVLAGLAGAALGVAVHQLAVCPGSPGK